MKHDFEAITGGFRVEDTQDIGLGSALIRQNLALDQVDILKDFHPDSIQLLEGSSLIVQVSL